MTNNVAIAMGAVLTTALIPGAEDIVQVGMTLTGGGLLTWIAVMQGREIKTLRGENRDLNRELGKRCSTCKLVKAANESFIHDRIEE